MPIVTYNYAETSNLRTTTYDFHSLENFLFYSNLLQWNGSNDLARKLQMMDCISMRLDSSPVQVTFMNHVQSPATMPKHHFLPRLGHDCRQFHFPCGSPYDSACPWLSSVLEERRYSLSTIPDFQGFQSRHVHSRSRRDPEKLYDVGYDVMRVKYLRINRNRL